MSSKIRQTRVMISIGLGSLSRRLWISLSMVLSIALVVGVLVGFLAMAQGFETALLGAGSPSVAVVLSGGASQEVNSDIPADAIRALQASTRDFGIQRDASGKLLISRELVVPVDLTRAGGGMVETVALRGMDATGPALRDNLTLSAGRMFASGTREIVVGDRLARDFAGLGVGRTIRLGGLDWTVVGHFSTHGSAFESEIWSDLDAVQPAFGEQGKVQTLRARLDGPQSLATLQAALPGFAPTPLVARSELQLFATQSARTGDLIRMFGWPLALLMATGAIAGALNTMMTSVADRSVEIATVRALGFSRLSAFLGTCGEAVVLSVAGALVGVAVSWLLFDGWQASTMGANHTEMAFQLRVSSGVMLTGGLLGLLVGALGGMFAAFSAACVPLILALRARA